MLIKIGFDIEFGIDAPITLLYTLHVHPSRRGDLVGPENLRVGAATDSAGTLEPEEYVDSFGNHCGRVRVPHGTRTVRFTNDACVRDSGEPDPFDVTARQNDPGELPLSTLQFLLPSRYCEVDSDLLGFAWSRFGSVEPGWPRVQAICDFVHHRLRFDYGAARPTRTAREALHERVGVCRDFAHLAVALCRCLNIPARYTTGYLGDVGWSPAEPAPMDFSAWFEAFLGDRWYAFDPRHNRRRIGRIVIARGRDAADVPITTAFGQHTLRRFEVVTEEMLEIDPGPARCRNEAMLAADAARLP